MKYFSVFIFLFVFVGCENVLHETAKTSTTDAIVYQAQMAMDQHDYTTAINLFQTLSSTYLAQRSMAALYASAYSGRCGLDFVNLASQVKNFSGSTAFLLFLMQGWQDGSDSRISDCVNSENLLKAIGNETQRNADENMLMAFSSLTKIGVILNRYADTDNNGTADAGFDQCSTTSIPDSAVGEIGTGVGLFVLSITAVSASLTSGALSNITNLCNNASQLCNTTNASNFSATDLKALRAVIGSNDLGIGSCSGSFTAPACQCP